MDFSQITEQLYMGTTPGPDDYEMLRGLGIQLVINMRFLLGRPPSDRYSAVRYMRLRTADNPWLPIPAAVLMRGARAGVEVLHRGGRVYVHCSRGRHRSAAMAAAILIAEGRSPKEAMLLIKARRVAADPDARHIEARIFEFARAWSQQKAVEAVLAR